MHSQYCWQSCFFNWQQTLPLVVSWAPLTTVMPSSDSKGSRTQLLQMTEPRWKLFSHWLINLTCSQSQIQPITALTAISNNLERPIFSAWYILPHHWEKYYQMICSRIRWRQSHTHRCRSHTPPHRCSLQHNCYWNSDLSKADKILKCTQVSSFLVYGWWCSIYLCWRPGPVQWWSVTFLLHSSMWEYSSFPLPAQTGTPHTADQKCTCKPKLTKSQSSRTCLQIYAMYHLHKPFETSKKLEEQYLSQKQKVTCEHSLVQFFLPLCFLCFQPVEQFGHAYETCFFKTKLFVHRLPAVSHRGTKPRGSPWCPQCLLIALWHWLLQENITCTHW